MSKNQNVQETQPNKDLLKYNQLGKIIGCGSQNTLLAGLLGLLGLGGLGGDEALLALLNDVELVALVLGHGDGDLVEASGENEDVVVTGGKLVTGLVLEAGDIEGSGVTLDGDDLTDETTVGTTGDHGDLAGAGLEDLGDLTGGGVDGDGVTTGDLGVGEADAAAIVGGDHGDAASGGVDVVDTAELGGGLGLTNLDELEAALGVVHDTEGLTGLGDGDDIHEASGELGVGALAAIDLDETLAEDHADLASVKGVLKAVAEDDLEGEALTELVGTSGGLGGEDTGELGEHPVLGSEKTLEVLDGHVDNFIIKDNEKVGRGQDVYRVTKYSKSENKKKRHPKIKIKDWV